MQRLMPDYVNASTNMSISDSGSNDALFKLTQVVIYLIRGGATSGHGCKQQCLHLVSRKGDLCPFGDGLEGSKGIGLLLLELNNVK